MGKAMSSKAIREAREKGRKQRVDKKRNVGVRRQYLNYLIVCEGEKTEPNYLKSLVGFRNSSVISVDIEGTGTGTVRLVKDTINLKNYDPDKYDRVWVVFDKDNFNDFNDAISLLSTKNVDG